MGVKRGYRQTEAGILPDDWGCEQIRDAAANSSNAVVGGPFGSDLVSADYVASGVPVIRGQNMSRGVVAGDFVFVSRLKAKALSANLAYPDDLVFTQRGTLGQVAIVPRGSFDSYLVSQSQMKVALDRRRHDPRFVHQYFSSRAGQRQIELSAIQTGVPHTNLGILRAYSFPAPPLAEQLAIAEALSDVDALLDGLHGLIAKKRDLKMAAMQQLLTGHTRLGAFGDGWEDLALGELAEVKTGPFGSSLHEKDYAQDGTPIITVEHLGEFGVEHVNLPLVSDRDRRRLQAYSLEAGDIVFSRVGSVDRNALIGSAEAGWLFSGRLLRVRLNRRRVHPQFMSFQFHGEPFKAAVRSVAVGQTMASLNTRILQGVSVLVPPLAEQVAIAEVLSDMDVELVALEARRDKTRALKQGMMQELLTGRTRLI